MDFDIESLRETLGDKFDWLKQHVEKLEGKAAAAVSESIHQRKGLKEQVSKLTEQNSALLAKLGVEAFEEVESLPDAKGAADAAKQWEAKAKRLERDLTEARKAAEDATGKWRAQARQAAIAQALDPHKWVDREIVGSYVAARVVEEGDEVLFRTDGGQLVPLRDGVAGLAKAKPTLLESTGAGGAGVRQANAGGGAKTITEAEFNAKAPKEQARLMAEGYQLTA